MGYPTGIELPRPGLVFSEELYSVPNPVDGFRTGSPGAAPPCPAAEPYVG